MLGELDLQTYFPSLRFIILIDCFRTVPIWKRNRDKFKNVHLEHLKGIIGLTASNNRDIRAMCLQWYKDWSKTNKLTLVPQLIKVSNYTLNPRNYYVKVYNYVFRKRLEMLARFCKIRAHARKHVNFNQVFSFYLVY